ncbi:PadR family transcriptional regulator [Rathayibacter soli]|uniref:PadR family transcriptional regulator n=1 Tax=Rathayibacter soli TaxID=3144168 RepID=UPI0027E3C17D|nr:PadR family transcriptional regulator [Glaciibacter superstes]
MKDAHNSEHGSPFGRFNHDPSEGHRGRGYGMGAGGFAGFGPGFAGFGPGGFGPRGFGPRGGRRANRGDIRSAILSLLAEGPSNGYGLIKAIAEKTGGSWRPSPGSVYPTLQQLVDEELIVANGDSKRTEYELSDAGREYVEENSDELARAWQANPGPSAADAAFIESVGKLMGVVHQMRHSATDAQRAAAIEKLDEARRALYLILAD